MIARKRWLIVLDLAKLASSDNPTDRDRRTMEGLYELSNDKTTRSLIATAFGLGRIVGSSSPSVSRLDELLSELDVAIERERWEERRRVTRQKLVKLRSDLRDLQRSSMGPMSMFRTSLETAERYLDKFEAGGETYRRVMADKVHYENKITECEEAIADRSRAITDLEAELDELERSSSRSGPQTMKEP
jgi:chromosome segregation ATPase